MSASIKFWILAATLMAIVILCMKPLGAYMANVMGGGSTIVTRLGGRFERWLYRVCGIDAQVDMSWTQYAVALLVFNVIDAVIVYGLQRLQVWLPLNPQKMSAVSADSSFNTAISFVTNTNWQGYSGESTMTYLVQMAGLTVQNFLSAASGLVVAVAMVRGFVRHGAATRGNVWVDVTRATLYVLLPLAVVVAMALLSQGVIQNFDGYKNAFTIEQTAYDNPRTDSAGAPIKDG